MTTAPIILRACGIIKRPVPNPKDFNPEDPIHLAMRSGDPEAAAYWCARAIARRMTAHIRSAGKQEVKYRELADRWSQRLLEGV